jgi:predicted anti-sigma-YlaC factor YlaD
MFDCKEVIELLGDYLENDVAADLRADLESHLAQCQTCRVILDSTRKTIRIVTESRSFDVPEELSERIIAKIMNQIPPGSGGKSSSGSGS